MLGRKVVAETLGEMVEEGEIPYATALSIADRILRRNALEFYNFACDY